ncbi:ABC transporter ATP-binding protein [Clostridium gasigenes]|uniref:ABC-2 type transport system ATP-binding protein n=1 Tax=Clostridium gasigenes TaxID=94869 RepID=A0A1H0L8B3_9CLOT|nr:ABC transporter ATP-binding protein [Clostridium gasigenes]MBU3136216.1 ABC transporter ATP-binding protein [Clostridium gasigenes]SDO64180.1 ABC-2 type transport system ATP-binding protein [Clostridium gasigenes]
MNILEIRELSKEFGDFKAVDGINLTVKQGEIYGLLGPNGAGKSTIINMICGLLSKSSGEIFILNKNAQKNSNDIKREIGIVPQEIAIYEDLTALENVIFFGSIYGLKGKDLKEKAMKALEFVGLLDKKKQFPSKFSGGMKRRLNIACALVHEPKLVIMDEPTVGIDPQSRNHILESIKKLNETGTTIIYTSHYMEEVEAICTKIAIIDNGKVVAEGTKEELKAQFKEFNKIILKVSNIENVDISKLKEIHGVDKVDCMGNTIEISTNTSIDNLDKILMVIMDSEVSIKSIEKTSIDLETVFLNLTGKKLRD